MNIGTPGAAYGPGFAVSRPTLGAGSPLDGGRGTSKIPVRIRGLQLPMTAARFNPEVHQNEIANRVAVLRLAQHPILAGKASTSPLAAAHAAITAPTALPAPPPLLALAPVEAAVGTPKPRPPRGNPGLGGLEPLTPRPGLGDFNKPKNVADLLQRAMLARRGMVA